jgi:uncharacterized FlaG/YvyC family protein
MEFSSTMSSSEVRAVPVEGSVSYLSKPAALPTKAEVPVPTEVPRIASPTEVADAVSVDIAGIAPQPSDTDAEVRGEEVEGDEGSALQTAEKLVENLRNVLASIKSTKVSFDVSIQAEGRSSLSFQVIDTNSGEVVREFPPEIAESLSHRTELAAGKGLLFEDLV